MNPTKDINKVENQNSKLEDRLNQLENEINELKKSLPENKITLIIWSAELDKVLPGFIMAVGAASMGIKVTMYFTFWGLSVIKKSRILNKKTFTEKLMALMMPSSNKKLPISKNNMMGAGALFLKHIMKEHKVVSLDDLINLCQELDVKMVSCQMTMGIMGVSEAELINQLHYGGVTSCLDEALKSKFVLFL